MFKLMALGLALELAHGDTDAKTRREQECLIRVTAQEGSNTGLRGMAMVIEVIQNRSRDRWRSNGTYCSTVYHKGQFEAVARNRKITEAEYNMAAQIAMTYLYENPKRLLPLNCYSFINPHIASDLSWYDPSKVVAKAGNHHFLINIK